MDIGTTRMDGPGKFKLGIFAMNCSGGIGTFPIVGSPNFVAETFGRMSDAGLDGMAVGLVNYLNDLPFVRDEILPRMARLGLR